MTFVATTSAATSSTIKAPATPRTHRVMRTERILLAELIPIAQFHTAAHRPEAHVRAACGACAAQAVTRPVLVGSLGLDIEAVADIAAERRDFVFVAGLSARPHDELTAHRLGIEARAPQQLALEPQVPRRRSHAHRARRVEPYRDSAAYRRGLELTRAVLHAQAPADSAHMQLCRLPMAAQSDIATDRLDLAVGLPDVRADLAAH